MEDLYRDDMEMLKTQPELARARMAANAARFDDRPLLAMLNNGLDPQLEELREKRAMTTVRLAEAKDKMEDMTDRKTLRDFDKLPPDKRTPEKMEEAVRIRQRLGIAPKTAQQAAIEQMELDYAKKGQTPPPEAYADIQARSLRMGGADAPLWQRASELFPIMSDMSKDQRDEAIKNQTDWVQKNKPRSGAGELQRFEMQRYENAIADAKAKLGGAELSPAMEAHIHDTVFGKGRMTATLKEKLENHAQQYNVSLGVLDQMTDIMKNHGFVVGIGGRIGRGAETIGNITKTWNATERKQFEQLLEVVRQQSHDLIAEKRIGRPLKDQEAQIAKIVPGLSAGSTLQFVNDAFVNLRKLYGEMKENTLRRLEGDITPDELRTPATTAPAPAAQSGSPQAKPPQRSWRDDPVVQQQ